MGGPRLAKVQHVWLLFEVQRGVDISGARPLQNQGHGTHPSISCKQPTPAVPSSASFLWGLAASLWVRAWISLGSCCVHLMLGQQGHTRHFLPVFPRALLTLDEAKAFRTVLGMYLNNKYYLNKISFNSELD